MARSTVRINIDDGKVRSVIGPQIATAVERATEITRGRVRANISRLGRVDSGRMRDTLDKEDITSDVLRPRWRVRSRQPYTIYQELGTRAHGPVTAPFLVFRVKGTPNVVRAKWVRGVEAGNFFRDALESLTVGDFLE